MHKIQLKSILNCLLIGLLLTLSACSTVRRDGPPNYNVDVSRIPDASPKVEPLSKYGNLASYRVFGKQYHVMKSSKDYEEQGIASWYGTKFHAQRTSNGERYNMLAMTAAHKSLPLPTYVQVTNLKNGRKVIVRVNDRGPFEGNRVIDLSYVAAKKLGMLGHGTAYVDVKAIDPMKYDRNSFDHPTTAHDFYLTENNVQVPAQATAQEIAPPHFATQQQLPKHIVKSTHLAKLHKMPKHFVKHQPVTVLHYAKVKPALHNSSVYLQVGAFKNKVLAEKQKRRLDAMFSSPVNITRLADKQKLYRVQIGPLKDVAAAKQITQRLKSVGLSSKQMIQANEEV